MFVIVEINFFNILVWVPTKIEIRSSIETNDNNSIKKTLKFHSKTKYLNK